MSLHLLFTIIIGLLNIGKINATVLSTEYDSLEGKIEYDPAPSYFSEPQKEQWNKIIELLPHLHAISFDAEERYIDNNGEGIIRDIKEFQEKQNSFNLTPKEKSELEILKRITSQTLLENKVKYQKDVQGKKALGFTNSINLLKNSNNISGATFNEHFREIFQNLFEKVSNNMKTENVYLQNDKKISEIINFSVAIQDASSYEKTDSEKNREINLESSDSQYIQEIRTWNDLGKNRITAMEDIQKMRQRSRNKRHGALNIYNECHWRISKLLYSLKATQKGHSFLNKLTCFVPNAIPYILGCSEFFPYIKDIEGIQNIRPRMFPCCFNALQIFRFFNISHPDLEVPLMQWHRKNQSFTSTTAAEYPLTPTSRILESIKYFCYMDNVSDIDESIIRKLIGKNILDLYPLNFLSKVPVVSSETLSVLQRSEHNSKPRIQKTKIEKPSKPDTLKFLKKNEYFINQKVAQQENQHQISDLVKENEKNDNFCQFSVTDIVKQGDENINDWLISFANLSFEDVCFKAVPLPSSKIKKRHPQKTTDYLPFASVKNTQFQSIFLRFSQKKKTAIEQLFFEKEATYKEFKTAWGFLGGWINKSTGSSHHKIVDPQGKVIAKGICKPHGKYSCYGPAYKKFLILPFELLGITQDFLKNYSR